jgi:hypothetical protein
MTAAWQLDQYQARLFQEHFTATVNLLRPAEGIHDVDAAGEFADAHLLGVDVPSCDCAADSLTDRANLVIGKHVRGSDLVAVFRETPQWPVRVELLWRWAASRPAGVLAAVELIVSVATELLDSRPALTVRTALAADEVLRLADAGGSRFLPLVPQHGLSLGPGAGPGCLLFRRQGGQTSYAEMIHPADFHRDQLTGGAAADAKVEFRHKLFPQGLEKGVILRAWLRGLFCCRADDTAIVAKTYRDFAALDPPLSA